MAARNPNWPPAKEALRGKARLESLGKGPVTLQSGKAGQFDVSRDGTLLYSRALTGRFPGNDEISGLFALKS